MTDDADKRARRRTRWSRVLLVVSAVLLPVAGLSLWARNQLLDTDRYVRTVAPLARDQAVTEALANRLTDAVVTAVDLQSRAEEALPDRAKFLAAPIAAGARDLVHTLALEVLSSDQFRTLWDEVNRISHEQVVKILTGADGPNVELDNGSVVVRLQPIAQRVLQRLDEIVPIDLSTQVPPEQLDVNFVLLQSDDLASVQSAVELFERLTWILLALVGAGLVASVLVSPDKRAGLQRVGLGVVISMVVTLGLYDFLRDRYLSNLPAEVQSVAAAQAVFDIATRYVRDGLRALLLVGAVIFTGAWLAGDARGAVQTRAAWHRLFGRRSAEGEADQPGPVRLWVAHHAHELQIVFVVLAIVVLLAADHPTGATVLALAVVVLAACGIVRWMARDVAPREQLAG